MLYKFVLVSVLTFGPACAAMAAGTESSSVPKASQPTIAGDCREVTGASPREPWLMRLRAFGRAVSDDASVRALHYEAVHSLLVGWELTMRAPSRACR